MAKLAVLTCVSLVISVVSVAMAWQSSSRAEKMEVRVGFLEYESKELDAAVSDVRTLREQAFKFEQRIVDVEGFVLRRAPSAAPTVAPRATPQPAAHWWCYFGRECFRELGNCINGDIGRRNECRPRPTAWCGGADGKRCFADMGDCISIQSQLEVGRMYGGDPLKDPPVPRCTEVE